MNHLKRFVAASSLLFMLLLPGLFFVVPAAPVSAASSANCGVESPGLLSFPTWYKYLDHNFEDGECKISLDLAARPGDAGKIILALAEILLRVAGLVSVGFVIYGGFKYILSQGEPENAKGARTTIVNALIGVGISMSAVIIVNLVGGAIN